MTQDAEQFGTSLATVPVFTLYWHVHGDLRASVVFGALATWEFLNFSVVVLPLTLDSFRRLVISMRRIQDCG